MFDSLSIGLANQLFYYSPALVSEARDWLIDCNITPMNTPQAIALQIRTYYPGGIREFLNCSAELITPAELMSV